MLNSFLKSSSLEWNTFTQVVFPSSLLLLVIDVPFRPTSWSVCGPRPTESAGRSCLGWMCGAGGRWGGEWDGDWALEDILNSKKKKNWGVLNGHHCSSSLHRYHELYLMIEAKIDLFALFLWWKMKIKDCPLVVIMSSTHKLFSVTNGFAGHARGKQEYIFPSLLWKVYQDISYQAMPLSLVVPIHELKEKPSREPRHSNGYGELPGPISSAWILEILPQCGPLCAEGHSVLSFREIS